MHGRHLARIVGLGLLAAAPTGCNDPVSPSSFTGTFVLAESRLPIHLYTNEFGAWFATADTIRFGFDGQGNESGTTYIVPSAVGISADTFSYRRAPFAFQIVNGKAEVSFPCPANANCAPPPHMVATRTASGLHITYPNSVKQPQDYVEVQLRP